MSEWKFRITSDDERLVIHGERAAVLEQFIPGRRRFVSAGCTQFLTAQCETCGEHVRDVAWREKTSKGARRHFPKGAAWCARCVRGATHSEEALAKMQAATFVHDLDCEECDGVGDFPCEKCGTDGSIECPRCDGEQGAKTCPRCHDDGVIDCPECDGNERLRCEDCRGCGYAGGIDIDDPDMNCTKADKARVAAEAQRLWRRDIGRGVIVGTKALYVRLAWDAYKAGELAQEAA